VNRQQKLLVLVHLIVALFSVTASQAYTWHVAQDGTGDFAVIQDAVDAASDGDVIHIHSGRYTEFIDNYDVWHDGTTMFSRVHVAVNKDNITLQGDGAGATIIGPDEPTSVSGFYYGIIVTYYDAYSLTIKDLSLEYMEDGILGASRELTVENCRFFNIPHQGMDINTSEGTRVNNCRFVSDYTYAGMAGVYSYSGAGLVDVSNSQFSGLSGVGFAGDGGSIDSCVFSNGITAINIQQGAVGTINNCEISEYQNYGLVVLSGSHMDFSNCTITGGGCAIWVGGLNASAVGDNCVFTGQTWANVNVGLGSLVLHDTDILNGGGWSVLCEGGSVDPYVIDLSNNYWGTDSADQIAAWIWDHEDDPDLSCTVDFKPFKGPVGVETHSWSAVKEMFRD
jgi:hypothetical protein